MNKTYHEPVLLHEVVESLAIKPNGFYVDATFGRGGHTRAILDHLKENGFLLAIDKDPDAVKYGKENIRDKRFLIKQGSFCMLEKLVNELGYANRVNGILLDLGVSSPQLDDSHRGFSFSEDGPLDMRMDPSQSLDAATWINTATEAEIIHVLREYGEERFAKRIARAILQARCVTPITRTKRLAEIVAKANPAWEKHKHPATRSFQAIRIHINRELEELDECLEQSFSVLAVGGRLAVISFHSLEDKKVKSFFQAKQAGGDFPRELPITHDQLKPRIKRIAWGKRASEEEVGRNPRSRSAILRVGEKLQ